MKQKPKIQPKLTQVNEILDELRDKKHVTEASLNETLNNAANKEEQEHSKKLFDQVGYTHCFICHAIRLNKIFFFFIERPKHDMSKSNATRSNRFMKRKRARQRCNAFLSRSAPTTT